MKKEQFMERNVLWENQDSQFIEAFKRNEI